MEKPIHPELVVVGTYPDELNANLAKAALESAGIEAMIRTYNASHYPACLGFQLLTISDNSNQAREILSSPPET